MCIRDHSYVCIYTQGLVGHTDSKSAHFLLRKTLLLFLCYWLCSNWGHWMLSPTLCQLGFMGEEKRETEDCRNWFLLQSLFLWDTLLQNFQIDRLFRSKRDLWIRYWVEQEIMLRFAKNWLFYVHCFEGCGLSLMVKWAWTMEEWHVNGSTFCQKKCSTLTMASSSILQCKYLAHIPRCKYITHLIILFYYLTIVYLKSAS